MKRGMKWLALTLAVVMCMGMTACGAKEFDAAGYTKSVLDANYHGEYAAYAEFRQLSEDEAKAEIEDTVKQQIETEFAGRDISDEGMDACVQAFEDMAALAKYEVKEAKKQDDGSFVVTVEIEPCSVYTTYEQHITDVTTEKMNEGLDPMSADVLPMIIAEGLQRAIADNTYGEAQTIEVKVTQNGDDAYGIEDSEMTKLETAMFPM